MNIILFTLPQAGRLLIDKLVKQGTPPSYVVPPNQHNPLRDSVIKIAHAHNIPVIMFDNYPNEETFVERIKELAPDLILVSTFPTLIPKEVYSSAKIAAINAHPSLLPMYRGSNPYFHVIANNEKETGVTLHLLDETFDTGEILSQTTLPISPRETTGTLQNKLFTIVSNELASMVTTIKNSGLPKTSKQKECSYIKYAKSLSLPLKKIDWTKSAKEIDCFIRAANPYYLTQCLFQNKTLTIHSGHPIIDSSPSKHSEPGLITSINKEGMLINTGLGQYLITSVLLEDSWNGDPNGLFELGIINIGDKLT